jgi:hypothetical protein
MKIFSFLISRRHSVIKKMILASFLVIALVVVILDIKWFYKNFENDLGRGMAQTVIAYHVVVLLAMTITGIILGRRIDQAISQGISIFHSPKKGGWTEAIMNIWGYELDEKDEIIRDDPGTKNNESFVLLDLPTRRGRKPTFPLERWLPIAAQWENRDPIRDAFTLGELISEHLGTNPDGSPIVSEQTYYSVWRSRAIAEIRRRTKSRKSPTEIAGKK